MNSKLICPIAIDLGAKNTGIVSGSITDKAEFSFKGAVISVDDKTSWSMTDRTARRHQRRGIKRRKMAKRLFWLILLHEYEIKYKNLTVRQQEAFNGLFNRRGFTFASGGDENKERDEIIKSSEIEIINIFENKVPELFADKKGDLLDRISQNQKLPESIPFFEHKLDKSVFRDWAKESNLIEDSEIEELSKSFEKTYKALKDYYQSALREQMGSKHRREYLVEIKKDIDTYFKNEDLSFSRLFEKKVDSEKLYRLIGNISNLQLRVLRKYFNQPEGGSKEKLHIDIWDKEKLRILIWRWIESWHVDKNEGEIRQYRSEMQSNRNLKKGGNIISFLTEISPEKTIPPYEDQNNRRPPECSSMHLDAEKLDKLFPGWKELCCVIHANFKTDIDMGKIYSDDTCREVNIENSKELCLLLQRYLDRSMRLDSLEIRKIVSKNEKERKNYISDKIESVLGNNLTKLLYFDLAPKYYSEIQDARNGLWDELNHNSILKRCGKNPPHKNNISHLLVGNILQHDFDEKSYMKFIDECWKTPITGRTTLSSMCVKIEDIRKRYGNSFNEFYKELLVSIEIHNKNVKNEKKIIEFKPSDGIEQDIYDVYKRIKPASEVISKYLCHDSSVSEKYSNPFTLAQLSNIIDKDIHGFSKDCKICSYENKWRMQLNKYTTEDKTDYCANAVRLSSDTVRPFDGMMARILDNQAEEIVKLKIKEIDEIIKTNSKSDLVIPVCIEQNSFNFTSDLADIKRSSKRKDLLKRKEASQKREEEYFTNKEQRIIYASKGLCPYTGEQLDVKGEIDHIIPRAKTKKISNTIIDHEANLIYCSRKGNQIKKDKEYSLSNLNAKYLNNLYGTANTKDIETQIETSIEKIKKLRQTFVFTDLSENEQRDFRHAFFCDKLKDSLLDYLANQIKARVNGTQAFFAKLIIRKLRKHLESKGLRAEFIVIKIPSSKEGGVSFIRKKIAELRADIAKQPIQPIYSHIVDAACVLYLSFNENEIFNKISAPVVFKTTDDISLFEEILPKSFSIEKGEKRKIYERETKIDFSSVQIFKDGIFAEHFVPVIINAEGLSFGFNLKNRSICVKNAELWFNEIKDYLNLKDIYRDKTIEELVVLSVNGFIQISFDKTKCLELLQKASRDVSLYSENESKVKILEGLRYTTARMNLEDIVFLKNNKKITGIVEALKTDLFTFKVNFKSLGKDFGSFHELQLILPSINEAKDFHTLIKRTCDITDGEIDYSELFIKIYDEKFNNSQQSISCRKQKTRKTSLPVIAAPSGGFRLRRKNKDDSSIYQLVASNAYVSGFDENLKNISIAKHFSKSRNIALISEFNNFENIKTSISLNQWITVEPFEPYIDIIDEIQACPGTKSRFYIVLKLKNETFLRDMVTKEYLNSISGNILNVYGVMKKNDYKSDFFKGSLDKPRETIFIKELSD
ncbi:MAG TPA: type II-B CRISPR-associated RNA-guided endonuclease Cas9/Csx12, partial [Spirochaetota bacterium]|nr:type II-B CRISPR-associated RNA-guided endonuclease Cas9/Csx12 [Spirochaetota bacterium]HPK54860.1 type II-B CRISPR-associated RNA-guided endonuclease Cas9/Csx12 [Spirochaetota bacterium]